MNHVIGAAMLPRQVDGFRPHDGIVLAEPGRSAWVFPFANHPPTVLFSYRTDDIDGQFRRPPVESIRRAFGPQPLGPLLEELVEEFGRTEEYLFDSVHQVNMPQWHRGRVVLLGDSAWCPTLYSGMGASSALAGADLLGSMLGRHPEAPELALDQWETQLRPYIHSYQKTGRGMLKLFTPQNRPQAFLRLTSMRLSQVPVVGPIMTQTRNLSPQARMKNSDAAAA